MLTISRALGASQAESYHRSEFTSPEQSYYTKGNVLGEWQGRLAAEWGSLAKSRNSNLSALTSHSAQGATADRVLIHVDTAGTHKELINSRLAYVAVSRARYDARIYTGDGVGLGRVLSHTVTKRSALLTEREQSRLAQEQRQNPDHEQTPAGTSSGGSTLDPSRSRSVELER